MIKRWTTKEPGSASSSRGKHPGITEFIDKTATSLYDDVVAIVDAKIELLKIELAKKVSALVAVAVLFVILLLGVGYLFTTIALLTGEFLGHPFLGYLLVSIFFLLCFLFFTRIRPLLLNNLIQKILLSLYDSN
jgi:hypothetical protein